MAPETLSQAEKMEFVISILELATEYTRKAQIARIRLDGLQKRISALQASVVAEGR